jgi:hypothetical protein
VSFSCVCVPREYCAHKCAQPTTSVHNCAHNQHGLYSYKQTHGTKTQTRTANTDLQENIQALQHTSKAPRLYKLARLAHTHKFEICKYLNRCGLCYALTGPLRPTNRRWLPRGIQPTQRKRNGSSRTTCRRTLNLGCPVPASSRCGVCVCARERARARERACVQMYIYTFTQIGTVEVGTQELCVVCMCILCVHMLSLPPSLPPSLSLSLARSLTNRRESLRWARKRTTSSQSSASSSANTLRRHAAAPATT